MCIVQEHRRAGEERRRAEAAEKQARCGSGLVGLAGLGSGFRISDHYAGLGQMPQLAASAFKLPDYNSSGPAGAVIRSTSCRRGSARYSP